MKCCAVLALVVVVGACGDDGNKPRDAAIDAKTDGGSDAGPCTAGQTFFTGEFVDWDSNDGAGFCGIFGATWTADLDHSITNKTNPNGRFQLCLASADTQIDITEPTAASQCTTDMGTYAIPGVALWNADVIAAGGMFSSRSMETSRATTFYASFGSTFAQTKGQLFVHVDGKADPVAISSSSDPAQAFDGTTWAAGTTGVDVFFPNIDLTGGTTTNVTVTPSATGTDSVPLTAGAITYVTVIGN